MTEFPAWFDPSKDRALTPSTIKGLLHPIRLRIFDLLQVDGPSTATTLGRQTGQSTASVSYHLRVLAEHGYIVEVPETRKPARSLVACGASFGPVHL